MQNLLDDNRSHVNKIHPLPEVVFLTIVAVMSGAEGWTGINLFGREKIHWLKQYLPYSQGIPAKDTIARVISAIKPDQLTRCFIELINAIREKEGQPVIAIDGKSLRHGYSTDAETQDTSMLHTIGAYDTGQGIMLGMMKSLSKRYEPNTVLELLDALVIQDTIITADAMNCSKTITEKVLAGGADYVLQIKGNQACLQREIQAYFHKMRRDDPACVRAHHCKAIDAGHGRIEIREALQLPVTDWFDHTEGWCGLKSVIEVTRTVEKGEKTTRERAYYISSLDIDPERAAQAIRSHWGIENSLHYVLDVTYKEDELCLSRGNAAENMALIRRLCFNLAKLSKRKGSMKGKLQRAGWSDKARSELIAGLG